MYLKIVLTIIAAFLFIIVGCSVYETYLEWQMVSEAQSVNAQFNILNEHAKKYAEWVLEATRGEDQVLKK